MLDFGLQQWSTFWRRVLGATSRGPSHLAAASAMLAATYVSLPWIVVLCSTRGRGLWVIGYDLLSEGLAATMLAVRWHRSPAPSSQRKQAATLFWFMTALGVADFLFIFSIGRNVGVLHNLAAELSYTVAFGLLSLYQLRHIRQQSDAGVTIALALALMLISLCFQRHFVLEPLERSVPAFSLVLRANYHIYSLVTALAFGLSVALSVRVLAWPSLAFLSGVLLCHLSDFMWRSHMALHHYASSPDATAGWTSGVSLMMVGLAAKDPGGDIFEDKLAAIGSVRSTLSVLVLFSGAALLALCTLFGVLAVDSVSGFTLVAALLFGFWLLANIPAMGLSRQARRAVLLLPDLDRIAWNADGRGGVCLPHIREIPTLEENRLLVYRYNAVAGYATSMSRRLALHTRDSAVAAVARQFSHDIQSPLMALRILFKHARWVDDVAQVTARSAVQRLQDIANHLLLDRSTSHHRPCPPESSDNKKYPTLVSTTLQMLVAEKVVEFRHQPKLEVSLAIAPSSQTTFVDVNRTALRCALSNLINNAAQAMMHEGSVKVVLDAYKAGVKLQISDRGCGMTEQQRNLVMNSCAADSRHIGLGLRQVMAFVDEHQCSIDVTSSAGSGTMVQIVLPTVAPPAWFPSCVKLDSSTILVVVDDDPTVFSLWRDKVSQQASGLRCEPQFIHLTTAAEVRRFCSEQPIDQCLFLVDFDLCDPETDGLSLIEVLQLVDRSILVTSCFEDSRILQRCLQLGVKLLPKPAITNLSIQF